MANKHHTFLTDWLPLIAFFVSFKLFGMLTATGVLMATTLTALAYVWVKTKKIAPVPLFSAILIGVFGGLTLISHDETFIKIKPTILNVLFGSILLGGYLFRKAFLKNLMKQAIHMPDEAWLAFSLRWGLFFWFLAGVNEWVWRHYSTDVWVNFKAFGLLGLTLVFMFSQIPFLKKHATAPSQEN